MGCGVVVYPSARESGKQIAAQTDEVWIERRRKPKNSAQKRSVKILWRTSKKFLTNGGTCAKLHQASERAKCFERVRKNLKKVLDKRKKI